MTGNRASNPPEAQFLLDESLSSAVARALNLVAYNFVDVVSEFGRQGVEDPDIIEWCRENRATWVHADDRANKEHKRPLQTSGIRTLWIPRPSGGMSSREQLRILSFALPKLFEFWEQSPRVRHYRTTASSPTAVPSIRPLTI